MHLQEQPALNSYTDIILVKTRKAIRAFARLDVTISSVTFAIFYFFYLLLVMLLFFYI